MVLGMDLGSLALLAVGALVGVFVVRYAIAYLNTPDMAEDRFQRALNKTARWGGVVFGGIVMAVATGLVTFGEVLDLITQLIGGAPFLVSNLAGIGLGAATLSGLLQLSPDQYIGIALAIVGGVFLISEVVENGA